MESPLPPDRPVLESDRAESSVRSRAIIVVAVAAFSTSIALCVPSCYESFWLDELHSAWTVAGDLGDVVPRARLGHQSPFYFVGLWFWKQAFGESELALRISSVLAVATSCLVLTIGVARWTRSIVAGGTAGMVLAIESNSLFFATELRPYAFVILFTSLATSFLLRLLTVCSRHDHRFTWSGLILTILLATLCQPTAIGILGFFPAVLLTVWFIRDRGQLFKFSPLDGLLVLATMLVGFSLWSVTLGESWAQRMQWASFAKATRVSEIWQVWDWTWLLLVPLGFLMVAAILATIRRQSIRELSSGTLALAAIAVAGTILFWTVSRLEWVPVWHRRYFIAVLPLLACVIGGCVGALSKAVPAGIPSMVAGLLSAAVIVIGLADQQGLLVRLSDYPVALVTRGEDWRGAVDWVRSNAHPSDEVFLHSGMIEAPMAIADPLLKQLSPTQIEYLQFPTRGPYDLGRTVSVGRLDFALHTKSGVQRTFLISRGILNPSHFPAGWQMMRFGNVTVAFHDPANVNHDI